MSIRADTHKIRLQRLDRADHVRYPVRTAILGRQFRDSGLDCLRSSDFDTGFVAAASGCKEGKVCSFSGLST